MTRASDMPVSTTCAWITAAIPSSTRVLNSLRKMVAGRAIDQTFGKRKPGPAEAGPEKARAACPSAREEEIS